jgi:LmbE family N-acetylglucosaminyl deacetylase
MCDAMTRWLRRLRIGLNVTALTALWFIASLQADAQGRPQPASPARRPFAITSDTRLLIVAPHPDDEVLAAGGVIQRVRSVNGIVRIVYLTDGEGYREGVQAEEHKAIPKPADYREYGRERKDEAHHALRRLGVDSDSLTFLGFPNNGLSRLMSVYWSDQRAAYRSPYTRRDRPTKSESIDIGTKFRGEDLTQELAEIIGQFKPTTVLVPRKEDQHVDHCAAWFFTGDAIGDVARVEPGFNTDLITYIIHYDSWPFETEGSRIDPPTGLSSGTSGWLNVPLTTREMQTKRRALREYKTQMKVMDWFLEGFVRRSEIFSRPARTRVVLPVRRSPCDAFIESHH